MKGPATYCLRSIRTRIKDETRPGKDETAQSRSCCSVNNNVRVGISAEFRIVINCRLWKHSVAGKCDIINNDIFEWLLKGADL